jgi:hypothetical protein
MAPLRFNSSYNALPSKTVGSRPKFGETFVRRVAVIIARPALADLVPAISGRRRRLARKLNLKVE